MARCITITLSDDEYQKVCYFADKQGISITTFCALAVAGHIDAELEGERYDRELRDQLDAWHLAMIPPAGTA